MAATNINRVIITGNLTRDPDLRSTPGGTAVCELRIASNQRRKDASGQWVDKPNYFDVTVWGAQGENCAKFLAKGRSVAIDGRLDWREWTDKETGKNRQAVGIVADSVQFLGGPREDGAPMGGGYGGGESTGRFSAPSSDLQVDNSDFGPAPEPIAAGSAADDDIPF
jgi:single-strand DNA-binding protein